jgi:hypothetical protein
MQYINFVYGDGEDCDPAMHAAPVAADDAAFLQRIIPQLGPLSEDDYMNGPAAVLHTAAKYSYILNAYEVFWCIEWAPGLIVIRFSPNQPMAWAAIRSRVPDFGGREASDAEWNDYDEDAEDPQYNLVFHPWDAQFDAQYRERRGFVPADSDVQSRFKRALFLANELAEVMERRFVKDRQAWFRGCEQNLKKWCGDGIRVK